MLVNTLKPCVLCGLIAVALLAGGCDSGPQTGQSPNADLATQYQSAMGAKAMQIETLLTSLAANPDDELLLSRLGDAYFESQRFVEAVPIFLRLTEINPTHPDYLNDLALSYFYLGGIEQAISFVNRATEVGPDYKYAWLSKGFILLSAGHIEEAKAPLIRVKELDPGGPLSVDADRFLREIEQREQQGAPKG